MLLPPLALIDNCNLHCCWHRSFSAAISFYYLHLSYWNVRSMIVQQSLIPQLLCEVVSLKHLVQNYLEKVPGRGGRVHQLLLSLIVKKYFMSFKENSYAPVPYSVNLFLMRSVIFTSKYSMFCSYQHHSIFAIM